MSSSGGDRISKRMKTDSLSSGESGESTRSVPTVTLNAVDQQNKKRNDVQMPVLGLGTYKFKKGAGEARQAVLDAFSVGIRHIDSAFVYGGEKTEAEIGEALSSKECKVPRSEVFLTSKQWRAYHGYEETTQCLNLSLKRLKTDYLDLYLIHWPGPAYNTMSRRNDVLERDGPFAYAKDGLAETDMVSLRAETWRAMEDAVLSGKCRAIGVSNFSVRHLEALRRTARIWPPAVNQIELHPYNPQRDIVKYCEEHGIVVEAYASLGGQDSGKKTFKKLGGRLTEREEVARIAERHGKTPAQVLLRWAAQQGYVVIPKSTNIEHMRDNVAAVTDDGWRDRGGLSEADMALLATLDKSKSAGDDDRVRLCWVRDPLKHLDFD